MQTIEVTGDPLGSALINNLKWKGLLIEPVNYAFQKLAENYSDQDRFSLPRVAVGDIPSVASFFYVDQAAKLEYPGLPDWHDQLGSFSRSHISNALEGILEPYILEEKVRVERLSGILEENGISAVTLLHVDTEGSDLRVLKSLDFNRVKPLAILIEHRHLPSKDKRELRQVLKEEGYRVFNCGSDYFPRN